MEKPWLGLFVFDLGGMSSARGRERWRAFRCQIISDESGPHGCLGAFGVMGFGRVERIADIQMNICEVGQASVYPSVM